MRGTGTQRTDAEFPHPSHSTKAKDSAREVAALAFMPSTLPHTKYIL